MRYALILILFVISSLFLGCTSINKPNFLSINKSNAQIDNSSVQTNQEQIEPPFIPDYNIACFDDAEDLIKKIAFYVNQDNLRKDVALRGYELAHGFTLHARIQSLLDSLSHEGCRS